MAATKPGKKRSYGTGSRFEEEDSAGRVSYYGQRRSGDVQIKRKIGPKRIESTREGLTNGSVNLAHLAATDPWSFGWTAVAGIATAVLAGFTAWAQRWTRGCPT
jgi:opacity protein-like surface antigen